MKPLPSCALAVILAAGCAPTPDDNGADPRPPEDRFDITRPGDTFLSEAVAVVDMIAYRRDDGTLEACEFRLENRGAAPLSLEVRTLWKGSNDELLGEDPWTPLEIQPGARKVHGTDATVPNCRHVKLEVRARN